MAFNITSSRGAVQIALTRSDREYGDTLDVTLGRKNPDNDLIMSYLASGAIEEANRLGEALKDADLLLYRKINDPVAAAAGAYFLLKSDNLKRRQSWVKNLVNWFPYLADGPILSAALGVQSDDVPESQIRDMITLALNRGLPVFSLGMTLLMETMAAIHRGDKESKKFHSAYLAVQAYTRARRSKGVYFSFHGKSPAEPTWVPIYGMEGAADYRGAVVYSRARGSRQKAKFGGLSISLPRAPVAARIIDELNIGTDTRRAEESTLLNLKAIQLENWPSEGVYRNTKILGLPVIETNFLNDFSVQSKRIATGFLMSQPESIENSFRIEKVKSNPKKVTKNWNEQRIKHATTVFDGTD
ncbi:hypothetical protein CBP51_03255 [Cellvibrio mixtus]|uniref:Uncharacterized protein n=1 Tax=Cellvibrio mixtus TaxID=39650 RepID=A0A266Q850_9GAMM|nr:hypothetical protein CBP51_03255 [Cellvibrio mixtus]